MGHIPQVYSSSWLHSIPLVPVCHFPTVVTSKALDIHVLVPEKEMPSSRETHVSSWWEKALGLPIPHIGDERRGHQY
jgi:hypothetical protein